MAEFMVLYENSMNEKSAENVHGSIKKFTRIMVFIALGFVGLYIFIFM